MLNKAFKILFLGFFVAVLGAFGWIYFRRAAEPAALIPTPVPEPASVAAQSPSSPPPVNKPKSRDKALQAAVDNVLDGSQDPAAYEQVLDYIWKEDELCLATVLLDYHLGAEEKWWPPLLARMFKEKSFYALHSLLFSFADEDRDNEIMAKLGSAEARAEPLLYAQFALTAWSRADRFEKILTFLEKNGSKQSTNAAYYYLKAIAAAEGGHPSAEVEGLLRQAFSSPELDFGVMPFYQKFADAAGSSGVNFLAMKKVDKEFHFTSRPSEKIILTLLQGKLRGDPDIRSAALLFTQKMESYGAMFRTLAFGAKVGGEFFREARLLRYLFEHPAYGATWKSRPEYIRGGLMDIAPSRAEIQAFHSVMVKANKVFDAISTELVEDHNDLCLRRDFDAFYQNWKRDRVQEGRYFPLDK